MPDPGRPPAAGPPKVPYPPHHRRTRLARAAVRATGPVEHGLERVSQQITPAVPAGPPFGGGGRGLEALGRTANGPAVIDDAPSKGKTTPRGQSGVSVRQEDLRVGEA